MTKIRQLILFLVTILTSFSVFAQKDKTLFTIKDKKVGMNEFVKVYEKNLSLITDSSQKDIDNYLELYINYKLKLEEAYSKKMDTIGSYLREYQKYENQLIQPYLKDENVEVDLLNEAYSRIKKEVNASHILIKSEKGEDTLVAYNKIVGVRDRILKGEDFAKVAREASMDPSVAKNGGNLGYFTAFQMVYPFENAVYNTKVGEISTPIKTQFGYHIIKVHDIRDSQGEIEVAHIMLRGEEDKNKSLIENLKKQLDESADFSELANNYSQDGGSNKNGGLLPKFGSGRMIPQFEKVAFSLKNEGDISAPFQTDYGWHIIKLIKKYPIGTLEEMKATLKQKIDQGQRAQILGNSVVKRLMKEYQISVNETLLSAFSNVEWENDNKLKGAETILEVENNKIPVVTFYDFYKKQKKADFKKSFESFKEEKILDIYRKRLPEKYPDLKETMKEYREGLLLFDVMQKKIWDKAEKDSVGLQSFFESNRDKYVWNKRAKMIVATLKNNENDSILLELKNKIETDSIWSKYKDKDLVDIREETLEVNSDNFPKELQLKPASSIVYPVGNQYKLYYIEQILEPTNKELNEVKGKVMSEYQDQLESNWIEELRQKYPTKINKKTLKKLKAQYNQ